MKISLQAEIESPLKFDFSLRVTARQVIRRALQTEGCTSDCEVSLVVTDAEQVHALNMEYRGIDSTTDVLSFPQLSYPVPSDFEGALERAERREDCFDPENGYLVLGDIVINAERVRSQAAEYGHSERREFAFLVAHSMLHLCGYDHMTDPEAEIMEQKQETILQSLGITRDMR
jgi:probable rRNA maturation factor